MQNRIEITSILKALFLGTVFAISVAMFDMAHADSKMPSHVPTSGSQSERIKAVSDISNNKDLRQSLFQGGVSDGGSTGILVNGRLILLDLYFRDAKFQGQSPGQKLITHSVQKSLSKWPVVVVKEQPAYQLALQYLAASDQSDVVKDVIRKALDNMEFWAINEDFPVARVFVPPSKRARLQGLQLKTIAMYGKDFGGAAISATLWKNLDEVSQAGTLIHEALRHIQYLDEIRSAETHLTDETIQLLTAHIVLGNKVNQVKVMPVYGWFLETLINTSDSSKLQNQKDRVCAQIKERFSEILAKIEVPCLIRVASDRSQNMEQFSEISIQLTQNIPDVFANENLERRHDYLNIRDEAMILYLQYLHGTLLENSFPWMKLNFRMNSLQDFLEK